ncbi:MAG: putative glycoside hydrolase [Fimbriimonadaceae bacterium]|nr:putative glycoside hydrolase [Fimbriimonadaceae bacterium]
MKSSQHVHWLVLGYALAAGVLSGCSAKTPVVSKPPRQAQAPTPPPPPRFPKPEHVRGIYLTAWKAGESKMLDNVLAMVARTEINAIVIDVRDAGHVYFKSDIPLAVESGAQTVAVVKPDRLFDTLEKAKVYPIARIACFRDDFVPNVRKELAVQLADGRAWKDGSGHTWLDPYNKENWEYIGKIVDFALDLGFPEIQLDYVRFPSEGKASTQVFPAKKAYPDSAASPTQVVSAFAHFIRDRVKKRSAVFSGDIFGIVSSGSGDQGIGQELEMIAEPFDLICPMVYPSHFAKGEYGIRDPNSSPHAIVAKSLGDYARRLPQKHLRPWLQDFSLGVKYGKDEVRAQIKAAREMGYSEYLLWNPLGRYTEAGMKDNSDLPLGTGPKTSPSPQPLPPGGARG